MAKLAQTSVKYVVNATFNAEGIVEKPDVIGALFGQTEGLLGTELDLRELQRTGRIGRIEVIVDSNKGKSNGTIVIPSSLDSTETALIAATIETIERVGPCDAKMKVKSIEDLRSVKRKYIIDRAKELLTRLVQDIPEVSVVTEELKEAVRSSEIGEFEGLPAGPDVATADGIVVCEGRADVINLLKHGVRNAIAIGGTSAARQIGPISKMKETTVFLDGDRGGDLILKELKQIADLDFVARAPKGKEVEELTKKEIYKSLREKTPIDQAQDVSHVGGSKNASGGDNGGFSYRVVKIQAKKDEKGPAKKTATKTTRTTKTTRRDDKKESPRKEVKSDEPDPKQKEFFKEQLNELIGTRAASIFDKEGTFAGRVPLKELPRSIKQVENPTTVIVDGYVDSKMVKMAEEIGVKNLIGIKVKDKPRGSKVSLYEQTDL